MLAPHRAAQYTYHHVGLLGFVVRDLLLDPFLLFQERLHLLTGGSDPLSDLIELCLLER